MYWRSHLNLLRFKGIYFTVLHIGESYNYVQKLLRHQHTMEKRKEAMTGVKGGGVW